MTLDTVFENKTYKTVPLAKGEYDNCTFINCNFSASILNNRIFRECEFTNCDFSLAKLKNTIFTDTHFYSCKLVGLHFDHCDDFLFTVNFNDCQLNLSSFYGLKMKKTPFKNCKLTEVDFTETDLSEAVFENCDLNGAIFDQSILTGTDFRTSYNYSIDLENNRIKKAKFSKDQLIGLLAKYDIHIE